MTFTTVRSTDDELTKLNHPSTDDINAKCNWQIDDISTYAVIIKEPGVQGNAAQVEWYVLNGNTYNDDTIGDVTVSKFSYSGTIKGSSKNNLCSANMFLEQTGLTFRGVYCG